MLYIATCIIFFCGRVLLRRVLLKAEAVAIVTGGGSRLCALRRAKQPRERSNHASMLSKLRAAPMDLDGNNATDDYRWALPSIEQLALH